MEKYHNFYNFFEMVGKALKSPFLLLVRLIWGYQFFIAGLGKLTNLSQVAGFFENLNIPMPKLSVFLVATFEVLGGISLFFGLGARLMSLILTIIMIVAYSTAHSTNLTIFSFITNPVVFAKETPFSFLYTSFVVFIFGPGKFSLDKILRK